MFKCDCNFTFSKIVFFSCVSPAGTSPMSSSPTVWCAMAPVLSGVWWGPEAGVVGSGTAASTGVASWLGSGQLILIATLSILTALLLVSVLLLLCASCQGWAPSPSKHTHIYHVRMVLLLSLLGHAHVSERCRQKKLYFLLCQLSKANLLCWEMQTVHKYLRGRS